MQEELAVLPAIGANNDPVADGDATRSLGDDLGPPGGFGQFFVIGEWNAIDDKHAHPLGILHTGADGIGQLVGGKGDAVLKNVGFLLFRPMIRKGGEAFEFFLVDHTAGVSGLIPSKCYARSAVSEPRAEFFQWGGLPILLWFNALGLF